LFFSGEVDSVGVGGTIAESLNIMARFSPNTVINASNAAILAILPARVEYSKPVALFISCD
jgi:hypothetical protein